MAVGVVFMQSKIKFLARALCFIVLSSLPFNAPAVEELAPDYRYITLSAYFAGLGVGLGRALGYQTIAAYSAQVANDIYARLQSGAMLREVVLVTVVLAADLGFVALENNALANYEGETCVICQGPYWFGRTLTCRHTFHYECIDSWLKAGSGIKKHCPHCRQEVDG